jgi:hypothetical protein
MDKKKFDLATDLAMAQVQAETLAPLVERRILKM